MSKICLQVNGFRGHNEFWKADFNVNIIKGKVKFFKKEERSSERIDEIITFVPIESDVIIETEQFYDCPKQNIFSEVSKNIYTFLNGQWNLSKPVNLEV